MTSRARMRARAFIVAILIPLLLLSFAPVALAAGQGSCPASDATKFTFHENSKGDVSDGADYLWVCGGVGNFAAISHTLPGNCNNGFLGSSTWDNCISSITFYVPNGLVACLYEEPYYYRNFDAHLSGQNGRYNIANDILSSIKYVPFVSDPLGRPTHSCYVADHG
jgi:hypothetical protein